VKELCSQHRNWGPSAGDAGLFGGEGDSFRSCHKKSESGEMIKEGRGFQGVRGGAVRQMSSLTGRLGSA